MARKAGKATKPPDGTGPLTQAFGSFMEYLEFTEDAPKGGTGASGGGEWAGADTLGQALMVARTGWAEGASRVRSIALPAVQAVTSAHVESGGWAWDVTGADYDVGEYLSGAPECWLTPDQPAQRPTIRIMANTVSSAGVPNHALENRGAAVVALALALQSAGYSIQVYAVQGMRIGGRDVWHRTCLSDQGGGPLDTDRVLFALAHVGSMRMLGYTIGSVIAGNDWDRKVSVGWPGNWSYGCDPATIKPPEEAGWDCDLYMPPVYLSHANWEDAASVERWVMATYDELTKGQGGIAKAG